MHRPAVHLVNLRRYFYYAVFHFWQKPVNPTDTSGCQRARLALNGVGFRSVSGRTSVLRGAHLLPPRRNRLIDWLPASSVPPRALAISVYFSLVFLSLSARRCRFAFQFSDSESMSTWSVERQGVAFVPAYRIHSETFGNLLAAQ